MGTETFIRIDFAVLNHDEDLYISCLLETERQQALLAAQDEAAERERLREEYLRGAARLKEATLHAHERRQLEQQTGGVLMAPRAAGARARRSRLQVHVTTSGVR